MTILGVCQILRRIMARCFFQSYLISTKLFKFQKHAIDFSLQKYINFRSSQWTHLNFLFIHLLNVYISLKIYRWHLKPLCPGKFLRHIIADIIPCFGSYDGIGVEMGVI